ncbi:uncharacterized protein LACBIDRAFT_292620 [Laccaria bicolor S238N-H82]|uniref:Predicted protein n=1 Tax=Laccaria bicolor (strain S238N-H82 / ATCC MYA-4686) TaxID=486041 RepID=B0CVW1_LACBS|nr:uncharacterized protein LACBIDRAFT_292620 [Laccaria bicolor S238N-H82]EDR13815.1 predicted protein [Laccaria bicolor S238N-H82]|eukprot:XP_001876313.1 predicted protein [Laccaria bicolor S238N-H82]
MPDHFSHSEQSDSDSDSDDSYDSSDSDSEPEITQEYLDSLIARAKKNAILAAISARDEVEAQEDVITLDSDSRPPMPSLDPGILPTPYFELGQSRFDGPSSIRDPDTELAEKASSSRSAPAPPIPPPELTSSGKPLTKKQKKEVAHIFSYLHGFVVETRQCKLKQRTAGPDWFDLPAPSEADLPRLHREVEALRLRNQLDPKRFYRKEEGEGKGIKGLPKYFAIGTILPSSTPFGTASGDNLTRANRKRTLVDELVDDAEAKRYAKKKFEELQSVRGARGRNTLHAKRAVRRGKW